MKTLFSSRPRIGDGRPVLSKDDATALAQRIVAMSTANHASVDIQHTARVITRIANNQVLSGDDGDELEINVSVTFGEITSGLGMRIRVNQLDDTLLRQLVTRCEAIARAQGGNAELWFPDRPQVQDTMVPVHLWHDDTVRAMQSGHGTIVPEVIETVTRAKLRAAGFLGMMARVSVSLGKDGILAACEETDTELTVTARSLDGKSSGWYGQAARNWSQMRPREVAEQAIEWARRGADPVAIEPGRRTAILSPQAVVQVMRFMVGQFDAEKTDLLRSTSFTREPRGNKRGLRVFDPRITIRSDPADPDGGYPPYFNFISALATPAMTWVEDGILRNLRYSQAYAMERGKPYADWPYSMRMSGGTTPVADMIAQCREGIYVNRFSNVELVHEKSCLVSGVTQDGCLLIKDGKIAKAAKNFRFVDSPFFFLNSLEAIGPTQRAAFGYTPPSRFELPVEWPRRPMIAPHIMVRDFNFVGIADAI